MTADRKHLLIPKIEDGIVIDHVPSGLGTKVLELFQSLPEMRDVEVSLGLNYKSPKLGRKDVIKLHTRELPAHLFELVALVCPGATIKRVADYQVERRVVLELPDTIRNLVRCRNPSCITNYEELAESRFDCVDVEKQKYRCRFCERVFRLDELERIGP